MTKLKLNEAAKELGNSASQLLGSMEKTIRTLQDHLQALKKTEDALRQAEEARKLEAQRIEEENRKAREEAERIAAEEAQQAAILEALRQQRMLDQELSSGPVENEMAETSVSTETETAAPQPASVVGSDLSAGEAPSEPSAPVQPEQPETEKAAAPQPSEQPVAAQPENAQSTQQQEMNRAAIPQPQPRPAAAQGAPRPAAAPQAGLPPRPVAAQGAPRPGQQMPRTPRQPYAPRPFVANPNDPNAAINRGKNLPPDPNRPQRPAPAQGFGGPRPFPPKDGAPAPQRGGAPRPGAQGAPRPGGAPRPAGGGGFANRNKGPELQPTVEKERVSNYDPNKSAYQRVYDPEKKIQRDKKSITKETIAASGGMDDDVFRFKKRNKKQQMVQQKPEPVKIDKAYMTAETITVKDLTERIGKPAGEIIKKLFLLGIMATINQELDFDTAALVCTEFGVELELKMEKTFEETLADEDFVDQSDDLVVRPPVVTVMGHVDHGKTSLLDAIRKTHVTASEQGGITQHIGAYTVTINGKQITFIDTPGHEAFTAMRARGAQVTDIAIIVVAADDGIMPQTIEAISHAKAAQVPIIVAVNKMDKPSANPDRIMQQLTEYELVPEEWGGDTIVVPVSATTGMNLDKLLEMILLVADVRELTANPDRLAKGTIIEAQLDKGRGPVATVLVQNGTLHVGDTVVAGTAYGRIRAMVNDKGQRVDEAGPSQPVEVIGFSTVPDAGDIMNVAEDDKLSRQVAEERRDRIKAEQLKTMAKANLDDLFTQMAEGDVKELNVIVKADVQGSVEAVRSALERLSNPEVKVRTIHGGVGAITETDIMLASASNAIVVGFNVRPDAKAREAAEREKVDVRLYRIIYQAIEEIQAAMKGMLAPQYKETLLGHAQVRQVFRITGAGTVAGLYVTDGVVRRNASVRLLRDNIVIHEGKLASLKRFKDDAKEVAAGYECGAGLENYNDIKENDVFECFVMEEIER